MLLLAINVESNVRQIDFKFELIDQFKILYSWCKEGLVKKNIFIL